MRVKQFIVKNRAVLVTLGIILIGLLAAFGILQMKGEAEAENPGNTLNEDRSVVYVTGKNYSLNKDQEQEFLEHEKQREERIKEKPEEESIIEHLMQNTETSEPDENLKTETSEHEENVGKSPDGETESEESSPVPGEGTGGENPGSTESQSQGESGQEPGITDEPGTGGGQQGQDNTGDNAGGEEEETRVPLIETTLVNNADVSGLIFSFEVWATDYKGNAMSADLLNISLNGEHIYSSGSNNHKNHIKVSYTNLELNDGPNEVLIRAVDKEGNSAEKKFTVNADASGPREEDGSVNITLELETLGLGTLVSDSNFKIYKGENVAFVVDRFLKENGIEYKSTGTLRTAFFLERIYYPNITAGYKIPDKLKEKLDEENVTVEPYELNSLGVKDFYDGSGMIYLLNGLVGDGMSTQTVHDGDDIHIGFTLNLIKEYNGEWFHYGEW